VAVPSEDNRIVASTSLIGPLPNATPASNPYQQLVSTGKATRASQGDANNESNLSGEEGEPLYFQMSAVYTSPEARGQGLAKSLIKAAAEEARSRARGQGRPLALSVVVHETNSAAISVYERCGFVRGEEEPELVFNPLKNSSEKRLNMYFQEVS
jgi:ribosomal protein S18 acetylase RimI-like enzyme